MKFVLFTDDLSDLSIREACRAAKKAGFDGLDLTLRPGGHVRPENAQQGLAAAHEIADEEGVSIPMVTTGITASDAPFAEEVIAAAHMRIKTIKLGYWRYEPFGSLLKQLDEARRKLEGIVALARRYHIRPCVHAHSGPILSNGPLLYLLLKDFPPADVGAYVDPMHMSYEGGGSGWEMMLDLLAPWVALVGVKNYILSATARDAFGQQRFQIKKAPLADGMAPLPQFFQRLKQIGYDGVVSLGSEYKGPNSFRPLTTPELLEQSAADLRYLKQVIAKL
ncbi:MAG: TIM barrel protein [Planctomycetaceae bacterium]|nr:TIM barrel protein [Planctomycetaceae bacterium]